MLGDQLVVFLMFVNCLKRIKWKKVAPRVVKLVMAYFVFIVNRKQLSKMVLLRIKNNNIIVNHVAKDSLIITVIMLIKRLSPLPHEQCH